VIAHNRHLTLVGTDLVKVRYQADQSPLKGAEGKRPSIVATVRNIVGQEGAGSLFRGLTPSLFGSAVSWGLYFYFYEIAKGQHRERQVCPPRPPCPITGLPTRPPVRLPRPELTAATALIEPPS
jgi:hypothetical protein